MSEDATANPLFDPTTMSSSLLEASSGSIGGLRPSMPSNAPNKLLLSSSIDVPDAVSYGGRCRRPQFDSLSVVLAPASECERITARLIGHLKPDVFTKAARECSSAPRSGSVGALAGNRQGHPARRGFLRSRR